MKSTTLPITCDTCKTAINSHNDAYVEWIDPNGVVSQINIVHNVNSSPNSHCFQHQNHPNRSDLELTSILKNEHFKKILGWV